MTTDDDWVKHAKTDDSVVAEILIRLARAAVPPPPAALSLDWSVRQRRSRAPAARRRRRRKKKKADQTRASPTTPLSWTAATTSNDSTKPPGGSRSKVSVKNEVTTTSKRPRKKKTLAELKEEETLLLKERKKLRKEIETMRLSVRTQRATNESLKGLKLDLESKEKKTNGHDALQCFFTPSLSHKAKAVEIRGTGFPLPDLNLPAEGDLDSYAAYCGIS